MLPPHSSSSSIILTHSSSCLKTVAQVRVSLNVSNLTLIAQHHYLLLPFIVSFCLIHSLSTGFVFILSFFASLYPFILALTDSYTNVSFPLSSHRTFLQKTQISRH